MKTLEERARELVPERIDVHREITKKAGKRNKRGLCEKEASGRTASGKRETRRTATVLGETVRFGRLLAIQGIQTQNFRD